MLHVSICEDAPEQLRYLEELTKRLLGADECVVSAYSDGNRFLQSVDAAKTILDIVLIDIELNISCNGIEIAKIINQKNPRAQIIFISAFIGYATELYAAEHVYFLTKPISESRLCDALKRAAERHAKDAQDLLYIKVKGDAVCIPFDSILYCESKKRIVRLYCQMPEHQVYEAYYKLDDVESLLDPRRFLRCHKSFLLNMSEIRSFDSSHVTLKNGTALPVSAKKMSAARSKYLKYIGKIL